MCICIFGQPTRPGAATRQDGAVAISVGVPDAVAASRYTTPAVEVLHMAGFTRALLNSIVALLVATTVAYLVGRNRKLALVAGGLSGTLTLAASLVGGDDEDFGTPVEIEAEDAPSPKA